MPAYRVVKIGGKNSIGGTENDKSYQKTDNNSDNRSSGFQQPRNLA